MDASAAQHAGPSSDVYSSVVEPPAKHPFRLLSQTVAITELDFREQSFRVRTELSLVPVRPGLKQISLHLGPACLLPSEQFPEAGRVTINDLEAAYYRQTFELPLPEDAADRSVSNLKRTFRRAIDEHPGDLIIHIPHQLERYMADPAVVRVGIDVKVVAPKEGVKFVADFVDDQLEQGAHVFTYRSNILSSTPQWLPCVNLPDQLSLWQIEVTVTEDLMAICSGEMVAIEKDNDAATEKTYHYQLLVPTSATNIGFAIGHFEPYAIPELPEITSFCLPGLLPLVRHTVSSMNRIFTFFEEMLSCRFPYPSYKQVFVDQASDEVTSFAGLSVLHVQMLYHKKILDVVMTTRQMLANAVSQQFFGCFVNAADFQNLWLVKALARFMMSLFVERNFGTSEYLYQISRNLNNLCDYEAKYGKIVMQPRNPDAAHAALHFDPTQPQTCSPLYADALFKKGHFLLRAIQKRLGKEPFMKVLNRILNVALQFSQSTQKPTDWHHMVISVDDFFHTTTNVTGREFPSFVDQWIRTGGHAHFMVQFGFNRKRNIIELEIKQDISMGSGRQSYTGPLEIMVQELDGCFTHTVQIDADVSKHDLQCHSKGRRQKRKRVPLSTGEEVDIDLGQMDPDSPVMWIRVDPEMLLVRRTQLRQPPQHWEYMLRNERDVVAQLQAVEMLQNHANQQTQGTLIEAVQSDRFFYRVRTRAALALTEVMNRLPEGMVGGPIPLIAYFQSLYGSTSAPQIPRLNNFLVTSTSLQKYFLMLALPHAIGRMRTQSRQCPQEVISFIHNLVRYNDNSINRYSDDHYRASLITALSSTLVAAEHLGDNSRPESLSIEARAVLEEVTHALNMDVLRPSFGHVVACRCLEALYSLQRCNHIPPDTTIFWKFGRNKSVYAPLRLVALTCLVTMQHRTQNPTFEKTILELLDVVLTDNDPFIRYALALQLFLRPPFVAGNDPAQTTQYPTNTAAIAQKLWNAIRDPNTETRLRTLLVDLYFVMYGRETPLILRPNAQRFQPMDENASVLGSSTLPSTFAFNAV